MAGDAGFNRQTSSVLLLGLWHTYCEKYNLFIILTWFLLNLSNVLLSTAGSKLADNVDDDISRVKNSIAQLYSVMNIEHHQIEQERKLIEKIEQLRSDLEPYEKVND